MEDGTHSTDLVPRLCHVVRWSDFSGYGFNLHAEKGKAGQFIGKVDAGSPAEAAGLRQGDRIVEVNGINIGNENHQQVVGRIKSGGDETRLLVVDAETDAHYKNSMTVVRGDLPEVRLITAARDQQNETPAPAAADNNTNGSPSAATPELARSQSEEACSPQHQVRLCKLQKWADFDGYGFNLHAEKDKPGQFIGTIDPNSPAETGGVREGDRIIEVNGENIEAQTHRAVIERVKAGGDRTQLLVVDPAADAYYKGLGLTLSSSMVGVVVITTPSSSSFRSGDVVDSSEQSSEPVTSEPASDRLQAENEQPEVVNTAETEVTTIEEVNVSSLPEPNVSLSDEETETIAAVVAEAVESAPEPPPEEEETVPNGAPVNGQQEEEVVVPVTQDGVQAVATAVAAAEFVEEKREEEEEKETVENVVEAYDYEMVSAPVDQSPPPPASAQHEESDSGAARNAINGRSEVPEPEPVAAAPEPVKAPEPEPEPAVIRSTVTSSNTAPAVDGDLNLHLSAAEMKERLRARKKQDPRFQKTSFEAKSKMFERM